MTARRLCGPVEVGSRWGWAGPLQGSLGLHRQPQLSHQACLSGLSPEPQEGLPENRRMSPGGPSLGLLGDPYYPHKKVPGALVRLPESPQGSPRVLAGL